MAIEKVSVRSEGRLLAVVDVEVFESLEAAEIALGHEEALRLLNAQYRADLTNKERAKHTKQTPEEKEAIARLLREMRSK